MLIRPLQKEEKKLYNSIVNHPLQSWEWGDFRAETGLKVIRIGFFANQKIQKALQVTLHPIPLIKKNIAYFPKGFMPDDDQIAALKQIAKQENCLFVKIEPNISQKVDSPSAHLEVKQFLAKNQTVIGKPLFTKYTFKIDLTQDEEDLFSKLSSKTRYNVRLAEKKGVKIYENTSQEGMEQYIEILKETTSRQGFYAHSVNYFRKMWHFFGDSGMIRIFHAVYEDQILVSWIMFVFKNVLYYPYGASRDIHREVMASNLMMWEMIKYGKAQDCQTFDLWGALGPNPDEKHPWYGFHRFKKGYGGDLYEFLGTFDLVMNYPLYKIFRKVDDLRWLLLRLKAKIS